MPAAPLLQTAANHLQLYSLNVSSEALWRLPDGQDVRRVNLYLSHRCEEHSCRACQVSHCVALLRRPFQASF